MKLALHNLEMFSSTNHVCTASAGIRHQAGQKGMHQAIQDREGIGDAQQRKASSIPFLVYCALIPDAC